MTGSHLDLKAIEGLYAKHKSAVYYRCLRLLAGNEDAAMDAMHQTFTRAIKFRHTYRRESDPIRWLFAIAFRVSMDRIRSESRLVPLGSESATLEVLDLEAHDESRTDLSFEKRIDQQRTVAMLLPRFKPKVQEAVVLRFFDELSVKEIAEQTGASERTVARRLAEFLSKSRAFLEREGAKT